MSKIKTASDFLHNQEYKLPHNLDREGIAYPTTYVKERMIAFAKLHVKAALEAAGNIAIMRQKPTSRIYVSKKLILASYPESKIK